MNASLYSCCPRFSKARARHFTHGEGPHNGKLLPVRQLYTFETEVASFENDIASDKYRP